MLYTATALWKIKIIMQRHMNNYVEKIIFVKKVVVEEKNDFSK